MGKRMKLRHIAVMIGLVGVSLAHADFKADLMTRYDDLWAGLKRMDAEWFGRNLSEDFVAVSAKGEKVGKAAFLRQIMGLVESEQIVDSVNMNGLTMTRKGNTATVMYTMYIKFRPRFAPDFAEEKVTDTWVNRGGKWMLTRIQSR